MFKNDKTTLQDQIRAKSDRELMMDVAYFSNETEKHVRNISNVANFFFWLALIGIIIWLGSLFLAAGAPDKVIYSR